MGHHPHKCDHVCRDHFKDNCVISFANRHHYFNRLIGQFEKMGRMDFVAMTETLARAEECCTGNAKLASFLKQGGFKSEVQRLLMN